MIADAITNPSMRSAACLLRLSTVSRAMRQTTSRCGTSNGCMKINETSPNEKEPTNRVAPSTEHQLSRPKARAASTTGTTTNPTVHKRLILCARVSPHVPATATMAVRTSNKVRAKSRVIPPRVEHPG